MENSLKQFKRIEFLAPPDDYHGVNNHRIAQHKGERLRIRDLTTIVKALPNLLGVEFGHLNEVEKISLLGYQEYNAARELTRMQSFKRRVKSKFKDKSRIANWDVSYTNGEVAAIHMTYPGSKYARTHYNSSKKENLIHFIWRAEQARYFSGKLPAVFSTLQYSIDDVRKMYDSQRLELLRDSQTDEDHVEIVRMARLPKVGDKKYSVNKPPRRLDWGDARGIKKLLDEVHAYHSFAEEDMDQARYFGYKAEDGSIAQVVSYKEPLQLPLSKLDYPYLSILSDGGTDPRFRGRHLMTESLKYALNDLSTRSSRSGDFLEHTLVIGDIEAKNDAIRRVLENHDFVPIASSLWVVGVPKGHDTIVLA